MSAPVCIEGPTGPSTDLKTRQCQHGIMVLESVPLDQFGQLVNMGEPHGWDRVAGDIGGMIEALTGERVAMVIGSAESLDAWRAELVAETERRWPPGLDRFIAGPDCGISASTIILALTGRRVRGLAGGGFPRPSTPYDSGDLGRCLRLLDACPQFRERLPEVAEKYPEWGPMVDAWGELEALYAEEGPRESRRHRPKTYRRLLGLVDAGMQL